MEVMTAFGTRWKGYTNPTFMRGAIADLGFHHRTIKDPGSETEGRGVVFVQWKSDRPGGGWGSVKAGYRHTHWVGVAAGLVFDVNVPFWITWEVWRDVVPEYLHQIYGYDFRVYLSILSI